MTFASTAEKRAYTQELFIRLASRYEQVNRVISLGRMNAWRRAAADQAQLPPGGRVLDVAAGTGGLGRALARRWPGAQVVGVDLVPQMIAAGRAQDSDQAIRWAGGDALRLPFPDCTFDAVVNGFMLRNVVDVGATLAEQTRVVRPGGRVVCLEMTWPRNRLFRPFYSLYFSGLVPLIGWLLTGYRDAYIYLSRSVRAFRSPEKLADTMRRVGLEQVRYRLLMMGTVTLHVGTRGEQCG